MVGRNSLVPKADPFSKEKRVAIALFLLTCCTVFLLRWMRWQPETGDVQSPVGASILFSVALMSILLAHEMGHFGFSLLHRFRISLPWFIPFPFLIGTLGAIIRFRDRPKDRTGLAEMAAAGPIGGFLFIVVFVGLWAVFEAGVNVTDDEFPLGTPLLFSLVHWGLTGVFDVSISVYSPMGFAAWIGCLVTSMNLLPFGQLDGGHLSFAMSPNSARPVSLGVTIALIVGGIFLWPGWMVWAAVLYTVGTKHPVEVRHEHRPVGFRARLLTGIALIIALLCFHPIPFSLT